MAQGSGGQQMQANQSQRQSAASSNQSNRQSTASSNQSNRQNSVSNTQNNYYGSSGCNDCWDGAAVAAGIAAGAIVAGAAASASQPATTTYVQQAPAPVAPPCNVAPIPVSGVPYYRCGATWYTAGYGSAGVVYMPVPPPPGY